ncbi:Uncharacterised protein [Mycobacteroides abscessus]|nr:Uncharacterised protein [Mycobacteroides abscessus]
MPTSVTATYPAPAASAVHRASHPAQVARTEPVKPVWNANQPITTVARKPQTTRYPSRPNVPIAMSPKFFPVLPAR